MIILITNDDGIESLSLSLMAQHLVGFDVYIVAPEEEKSAVSHGLTIRDQICVRKSPMKNAKAFSVNGTPVDCVRIALDKILPRKPDVFISGINKGSNTGWNIFYSGTVAAALEAFLMGVPSVSISLDSFDPVHLDVAVGFLGRLVKKHEILDVLKQCILNINIPDLSYEEIKGVQLTRQGLHRYEDKYVQVRSNAKETCYRLIGQRIASSQNIEEDESALQNGWISVTPLKPDFNVEVLTSDFQIFLQRVFSSSVSHNIIHGFSNT